MYTLSGRYCPPLRDGLLAAVSADGGLTTVQSSFPGSFWPGPLYETPEAALAAWRSAVADAAADAEKSVLRPERSTLGRYITVEQCRASARDTATLDREEHHRAHEQWWRYAGFFVGHAAARAAEAVA